MTDATLDAGIDGSPDAAAADSGSSSPSQPGPEAFAFVPERLGVGSSWYIYDGATHALTPEPVVYLVRGGELSAAIEIISYYNERGESGYFTLRIQSATPTARTWPDAQTLRFASSVKEAPVCVDLQQVRTVDCSAPHDLVARTDRRVIPAAGFAVVDASLHVVARNHGVGGAPRVWSVPADQIPSPDQDIALPALPSALLDVSQSLLAPLTSAAESTAVLQATTDSQLVQWRLNSIAVDETGIRLQLDSRCVALATSATAQAPLDAVPIQTTELQTHLPAHGELLRLDLCDTHGLPTALPNTAKPALWPGDELYDVLIRQTEEGVAFLGAPGTLLHIPYPPSSDGLPVPTLPASLWD